VKTLRKHTAIRGAAEQIRICAKTLSESGLGRMLW
jgi:hypothetical protein